MIFILQLGMTRRCGLCYVDNGTHELLFIFKYKNETSIFQILNDSTGFFVVFIVISRVENIARLILPKSTLQSHTMLVIIMLHLVGENRNCYCHFDFI